MKRTIAIVMLVVLLVGLFAGCGGKSDAKPSAAPESSPEAQATKAPATPKPTEPPAESKYIGVYKFSKMISTEMTMTVQEYADLFEIDVEEAEKFMILELKADGKGSISSEGDVEDITWKVNGDTISLTAKNEEGADETYDCSIKDVRARAE